MTDIKEVLFMWISHTVMGPLYVIGLLFILQRELLEGNKQEGALPEGKDSRGHPPHYPMPFFAHRPAFVSPTMLQSQLWSTINVQDCCC